MKTVTLFLVVAILYNINQSPRHAAAQAPYTLVDSRTVGSNVITLCCRNSNADFDSQAMYFLNGTRLDLHDGFQDTDEDPGTVVFQINRRLEGEYSCGTELQRSPLLSFVGKHARATIWGRQGGYLQKDNHINFSLTQSYCIRIRYLAIMIRILIRCTLYCVNHQL